METENGDEKMATTKCQQRTKKDWGDEMREPKKWRQTQRIEEWATSKWRRKDGKKVLVFRRKCTMHEGKRATTKYQRNHRKAIEELRQMNGEKYTQMKIQR